MPIIKKNRILIIDDDPVNILILEEILGKTYELLTATSEQDVLSMTENFKPDLILLDIMMQGANGYDLCKQLKSNIKLKFTKIILVSSKALLKDRLIGYEAGADDYLSKPFDPEELLAKVGVFIRLKSVEEIDRVKDDLINVFSHETRTPLNAIIGFAKLLRSNETLPDEEKEFASLILESGMSLLNLSNKAILLSNLRKENKELSISESRIAELVSNAARKLPEKLKSRNIKYRDAVSRDAVLSIDARLVETAILYTLDNAFKYSPDNSAVSIDSQIEEGTGRFLVNIRDSGAGVAPGRLPTLFDEFGIEDVGHHGRGHGLSLSIVKYIMETHNGEVTVKNNTPSPGCTFSLVFPKELIADKKAK